MAYVGGKSLKEIANAPRRTADGKRGPLPVEQACRLRHRGAGGPRVICHSRTPCLCDFKVDNAIRPRIGSN